MWDWWRCGRWWNHGCSIKKFTGVTENVHAAVAVDSIAADGRDLIAARVIERIPCEQPIVAIGRVRVMNVQLQLGLIQIRHFTIEGAGLRTRMIGKMCSVRLKIESKRDVPETEAQALKGWRLPVADALVLALKLRPNWNHLLDCRRQKLGGWTVTQIAD